MFDEGHNIAEGSIEILKVMMLVGALVGIFSVSQFWFNLDFRFVQFDYTGYDFFMITHGQPDTGYFIYMPLAVIIVSVLAMIPSIMSFFSKYEKKGAIAGILMGVVILVAVLLFVFYPESQIWLSGTNADYVGEIRLRDSLGSGIYAAVVSGIFLILGGAVILLHRRIRSEKD
jgi:hypothetical protein